jgi:dTDP-4-amino-4,6-dideoxygalactose transaminase
MILRSKNKRLFKKKLIPFHVPLIGNDEIKAAQKAILDNTVSGNGPLGRKLEERFKRYVGSKHVFFTTSCTSAIEIALMALGIGKGDEVIVPSFSFVSVANAVVKTGARLIFVDVDEDTLNMDPALVKKAVTRRTKAIIPVHYAGHSCRMDEILSIARKFNIKVIEDAAQSVGSFYKGKHLGTIGDIGCISLHGTKNITCGEGGMFLTDNKRIGEKADIIREKGTNRSLFLKGKIDKYNWISTGSSYVQSDILAAIAIEQLKKIDWINRQRRKNAGYLNLRLRKFSPLIKLPHVIEDAESNWHIYAVMLQNRKKRDWFMGALRKKGIECASHFVPLHVSLFARKYLGCKKGDYPVTEKVCGSLVRIPIYPQLNNRDLKYISSAIENIISHI